MNASPDLSLLRSVVRTEMQAVLAEWLHDRLGPKIDILLDELTAAFAGDLDDLALRLQDVENRMDDAEDAAALAAAGFGDGLDPVKGAEPKPRTGIWAELDRTPDPCKWDGPPPH